MAEYLPPLVVEFQAKTAEFEARLTGVDNKLKGVGETAKDQSKKMDGLKGALVGVGSAFAVGAVVDFTKKMIDSAEQGAKVDATLGNITNSMGLFGSSADAVTARLQEFATQQIALTGIDDDVIKGGQAKLMTFSEVAKSANVMGGAFDQATKLAMDLSAAGFGSVDSASVMLGKALQDPVAGVSALRRVGVSLSAAQTQQVKDFMKVNDVASAQKVILGEVAKQVGGTAAASATPMAKMKALWDDMTQSIGAALLPAVNRLSDFISSNVIPAFQKVGDAINWAKSNMELAVPAMVLLGGIVIGLLAPSIVAAAVATWSFTVALLANPIVWIVIGVMALIAAIILLAMNWDKVVKWIGDVWNGFMGWISDGFKAVMKWWNDLWTGVWKFVVNVWNGIVSWFNLAWANFINGLVILGLRIKIWWNGLWHGISTFFSDVWKNITGFFASVGKTFMDIGKNIVDGIWNGIKNTWGNFTTWIGGLFNGFIDKIKGLLGIHSPSTVFHGFGTNLMQGLVNGIDSMKGAVGDSVTDVAGLVTGGFNASIAMPGVTSAVGGSMPTGGAMSSAGYRAPTVIGSGGGGVVINTNVTANTNATPESIAQATVNAIKFNAPVVVGH